MIFVQEVHKVIGSRARDFEAIYREQWLPALGNGDGRLLWYANHAHLTCFAYQVLTIIAVPDGAAWLRLASRIHAGDLREPTRALDERRHDVMARLLVPAPGSPLRDLDLADVPETGIEHEMTLFVEETFQARNGSTPPRDDEIAEAVATFAVAHPEGSDERVVWRRVRSPERLLASLAEGAPRGQESPGTEPRESRLWRLSPWSPLDSPVGQPRPR